MNNIHESKERIIEGELKCEALVRHLEQSNYPKSIILAEDASGIVKRVVFDSRINQLVGLLLPLSENNGMPVLYSFQAESAEKIKQYMELPQSKLVYVIVAQPLAKNAKPFILQIYGTDNKFTTSDVLKRWDYIGIELKK